MVEGARCERFSRLFGYVIKGECMSQVILLKVWTRMLGIGNGEDSCFFGNRS